jgi:hypothetical protein
MIIMNGIDSGGNITFRNSKAHSSTVDYIILSDNIVLPDEGEVLENLLDDKKSGSIHFNENIPDNSNYVRTSMKVYSDFRYQLGDHYLVACKIKMGQSLK